MLTTGGGRLAGVDVADNDHVNVHLLLTAMHVSNCMCDADVGQAVPASVGAGWCLPHDGGCVL
jgi:hypothetical protein